MKGFFKWFKSSTKIKRWMLLMILGIILVCYGMAKVIVTNELTFGELAKIILTFVFGFTFTIISIICIQKRTLEMLVEESDTRNLEDKGNINSLIFNKKVYNQGPKIVVIATQGKTEEEMNLAALEDIEQSIIALSANEDEMSKLINLKMTDNTYRGKKFGDIYLTAMKEAVGDFTTSVKEVQTILNMTGKVLPATYDRVAPGVIDAIKEADSIVIRPGSLYTNVIPNLLVPGVSKAIREAKGFKVYVSNIMTENGQTDNYTLYDHIKAIIDHVGKGIIDYCVYDTGEIVPEYIRSYNKEGSDLVEQDISKVKDEGIKLIQRNLSTIENGRIRHNPDAIATSIIQLICDELKFRDMQNDTQYIMLDSKIKDTKKKLKQENKKNKPDKKKSKKKSKHSGSKFLDKYNERITSIRESENKRNEKMKK